MKKFEYKAEPKCSVSEMNKYGQQGWELVTIQRDYTTHKHWFYFKREIL